MKPYHAILVVFALSTPTMAQAISNENGTSTPNDNVLRPNSSAKKRVDGIDGRAPLPCDGKVDKG